MLSFRLIWDLHMYLLVFTTYLLAMKKDSGCQDGKESSQEKK